MPFLIFILQFCYWASIVALTIGPLIQSVDKKASRFAPFGNLLYMMCGLALFGWLLKHVAGPSQGWSANMHNIAAVTSWFTFALGLTVSIVTIARKPKRRLSKHP